MGVNSGENIILLKINNETSVNIYILLLHRY